MTAFLVAWFDLQGWHSQPFQVEQEARVFAGSVSGLLLSGDSDFSEWTIDAPMFGQLMPVCGGSL